MESSATIHKITIAQTNAFTVDAVTQKFTIGVPKAATFGFQVVVFVMATLLAITFIQFLLNRD